MEEAVIVAGARTPVGKFQGGLAPLTAPRLGAVAVREAVRRAGIESTEIDECILGHVLQAGLGQNPARQAALLGGLAPTRGRPDHQQGLRLGPQGGHPSPPRRSMLGDAEFVVAGGMESMSNCPYLLPGARQGPHGQCRADRLHDQRRPVGRL